MLNIININTIAEIKSPKLKISPCNINKLFSNKVPAENNSKGVKI